MNRTARLAIAFVVVALAAALIWSRVSDSGAPTEGAPSSVGKTVSPSSSARSAAHRYEHGATAPTCRVRGIVEGKDGPVAGATIHLVPRRRDLIGTANLGVVPPPIVATSDRDGGFQLARIVDGPYSLSASHPDWLAQSMRVQAICQGRPVRIEMVRGGVVISGVVSDVLGGPVEGAVVSAMDPMAEIKAGDTSVATVTRADGRYRLRVVPGSYSVGASHVDYVAATSMLSAHGDTELDLTLTPGAVVEGVVLRRDTGEPVAGARVSASSGNRGGGLAGGGLVVTADGAGKFRLRNLDSGVVRLSARYRGLASPEPTIVSLSIAEHVTEVTVYVDAAFQVSGRVVAKDAPDEGISQAHVALIDVAAQGSVYNEVPTASDGSFTIQGVRPGSYMLNAIGGDAMARFMAGNVTVQDQDVAGVVIEMDRGSRIRGRVEPATSAKIILDVDFANVGMLNAMSVAVSLMSQARTDANGRFDIGPVADGTFAVVAEADDGRRGRAEVKIAGNVADVVVKLEDGIIVAGRVVDQKGRPLPGTFVSIAGKGGSMMSAMAEGLSAAGKPTDERGRFELRVSKAGSYELSARDRRGPLPRAGQSGKKAYEKLEVDVGEAGVDDIELKVTSASEKISGVVVDGSGVPLRDAWVRAELEVESSQVQAPPPTLTDEDGHFVLGGLREGTFTVSASSSSGELRTKKKGVSAGSSVRLRLGGLGVVTGVVTSGGAPVHPYVVRLVGEGNVSQSARVFSDDGRFRFDRVEPGTYQVQVKADQGMTAEDTSVAAGGTVEIQLRLSPFAKVRGRLVDGSGKAIAGAAIWVMPMKGGKVDPDAESALAMISGRGPKTGDDGRFVVERVPPGPAAVMFFESGNAEIRAGSMSIGGQPLAVGELDAKPGDDVDLGDIAEGDGIDGEDSAETNDD